jgi:hypothetical protein
MRKNIIALVTLFGGVLLASIGLPILIFAFNYRQILYSEYFILLFVMIFYLYNSGIYISATLFHLYSKLHLEIEPSALAFGSIIGLVLGRYLTIPLTRLILDKFPLLHKFFGYHSFDADLRYILGVSLLFSLLGIRAACAFELNKSISLTRPLLKSTSVVVIGLILQFVLFLYRSDFPGVNASLESRQKWAYQEFDSYPSVVNTIGLCNEITAKLGKIKFIAPTKGRNISILDPGSLAYADGSLTIEVVGEKGTGIVYMNVRSDDFFEYQGKKTRLECQQKGIF